MERSRRGRRANNLSMPLFVYHAVNDTIVSVAGPDAVVPHYCASGARVTCIRDSASEHATP